MSLHDGAHEVNRISNPLRGPQDGLGTPCRRIAQRPANSRTRFRFALEVLAFGLFLFGAALAIPAQEERGSRLPVLGKISGGTSHQAFNGNVEKVDMKRNLLRVNTVEGRATEFFPIKKNVPVSKANGEKIKVQDLEPGTNIIVYYDQKEDRRTVSEIIVLASAEEAKGKDGKTEKEKKKSPPPS